MTDVDASQLFSLAAGLESSGIRAGAKAVAVVRTHGLLLQTRVKRRAGLPRSGPPGPRIITGDYNRSIGLAVRFDGGNPVAEVGTNRPQGRRLELGFSGADALGRVYDQPPYPHFGPALDETEPGFVAAVAAIADLD